MELKTYFPVGTILQVIYNDPDIIKLVIVLEHTKTGTPRVAPVDLVNGIPTLDDRYQTYMKDMHWSQVGWKVYGREVIMI